MRVRHTRAVVQDLPPPTPITPLDKLIARLSTRSPRHQNEVTITLPPKVFELVNLHSRPSSLGNLDCFPVELLHMIFGELDILSLTHLARASFGARKVVVCYPVFHDLTKYAFPALRALAKTQCIKWHTASVLKDTLRSEKCGYCANFGPFLYLPTAERVCNHCLRYDKSLWCSTVKQIQTIFGLSKKQLKDLIQPRIIPGVYCGRREMKCKIVNTRQAKAVALKHHGSQENLQTYFDKNCRLVQYSHTLQCSDRAITTDFELSKLEPPCTLNGSGNEGVASIFIPSLRDGTPQHGLRCGGCLDSRFTGLSRDFIPHSYTPQCRACLIHKEIHKARNRHEFIEHIKTCEMARLYFPGYLKQWEEGCTGEEVEKLQAEAPVASNAGLKYSHMAPAIPQ